MRKPIIAIFGLAALAALPAAIVAGQMSEGHAQTAPATDSRQPIFVTEATRVFVLGEMRAMLAAAQGVAEGVGKGDAKAAAAAAAASGLKAFQGMPKEVMAELPQDFRSIGMQSHRSFDKVAEAANASAAPEIVSARLGETMQFCVACHESFRFASKP